MLFEPFYLKKASKTEESIDHDAYKVQSNVCHQLITFSDNSKLAVRNVPAVVSVPYFKAGVANLRLASRMRLFEGLFVDL